MIDTNRELTGSRERGLSEPRHTEREEEERAAPPSVDIYETPEHVVILADMPGVREQDLEVTVHRGMLVVRGEAPPFAAKGHRLIHGRARHPYERTFRLSEAVDAERITASMRDGVLRLELAKREELRPRRIQVGERAGERIAAGDGGRSERPRS